MTDFPSSNVDVCPVCECPDGDHYDWCTPQARETRSSKEQLITYLEQCANLADKPGDGVTYVAVKAVRTVVELLRGSLEPVDAHAYATKDDLFNAGATQACYRYIYRDALMKISEGPPGTLPNDEVAAWAGQIANDVLDEDSPSKPPPGRIGPNTPDNDMVICPQCTSQFVAIPVNVQRRLAEPPAAAREPPELPRACPSSDDGLHECKECDQKWGAETHAPNCAKWDYSGRVSSFLRQNVACSCRAPPPQSDAQTKISNLIDALNAKQMKIDALMLEFCPGEIALDDDSPSHPPAVQLPMLSDMYKLYEAFRQVGELNWPFHKDHQAILNMIDEKYGRQMGDLLDDEGEQLTKPASNECEPADPAECCIFGNGSGNRCVTHQTTWGSGPCPATLPKAPVETVGAHEQGAAEPKPTGAGVIAGTTVGASCESAAPFCEHGYARMCPKCNQTTTESPT